MFSRTGFLVSYMSLLLRDIFGEIFYKLPYNYQQYGLRTQTEAIQEFIAAKEFCKAFDL